MEQIQASHHIVVTIPINSSLGLQLRQVATQRQQPEADLVQEALTLYLEEHSSQETAYEKAKRLGVIGVTSDLPADLSTNPEYFGSSVDLVAQGIDRDQAQALRASFSTFREDWESPEMSIYDDYDAARNNA
jgi:hypothetical protein